MARILVVDDTPQNLTLIELYLRNTEFEVVTAANGHDALELCFEQTFELILLDVAMPGVDGFEVCRRLKNDARTAFVPVIFLTGRLSDESEKLAAYQLGAVDYIQKPINREELVARIRVMLQLEQVRSRLDRENSLLRRQLEDSQRNIDDQRQLVGDLQQLRRELTDLRALGLIVLAPGQVVEFADSAAVGLFPDLEVDRPLTAAGHAAARLARLVDEGARSLDLQLPGDEETVRAVQVRVRDLADQRRLLLLHDVSRVRGLERRMADREVLDAAAVRPKVERGYSITEFVGRSASVERLADEVGRLRESRSTVLVYGESGTGKELIARALHFDGKNRSAPFIPLHCGAIAPDLIESELFGYEKGAFTGAQQSREGLFQAADGGTIFLDEIGEAPLTVQVKLLRVLQRGEIRAVGSNQARIVDVRILAATNRDLLQMVREGRFREDLYYRLEVVTLHLPSLRERLDDLPLLVEHFLRQCNIRHGRTSRPVRGVSRAAMERMLAYPWPGNVRELENVVERAFALGVGDVLQEEDLPRHVVRGQPALVPTPVQRQPVAFESLRDAGGDGDDEGSLDLRTARRHVERQAILRALQECDGDKSAAAQRLGMARSTFYRRLRELGL